MTPEAVEAAINAGDIDACIALFANATEAQRAAVTKSAQARLKALTAEIPSAWVDVLGHFSPEDVFRFSPRLRLEPVWVARAAVLASAPFSVVKKLGARGMPRFDAAYAVLATRRPPWIGEWVAIALTHDPGWLFSTWPMVRRLVREGLCPRPADVRYVDGMIVGLGVQAAQAKTTLREVLLADAGLLDDEIWLLFETEPRPGALTILSDSSLGNDAYCWKTALVTLANEGRIPRRRLLEASFGALERDFHEARSRWFVQLHEALNLSEDERAEFAERYLGLLASRNPSTVTFAVKALGAIEKGQGLDAERVIATTAPALQARAKGTIKAALALLDRAVQRVPALGSQAALAAMEALVHEAPDIHGAVLDLIERHGDPANQELAALLRERAEAVAPSHRSRLDAWLGQTAPVEATDGHADGAHDLEALEARVAALDPVLAERAGVLSALEVVRAGGGPVPAALRGALDVPRLDPARRIAPINDLDTLVDVFSALLESPNAPDDVERVLDGVSRLCDQRPDDFEARTAALHARAETEPTEIRTLLTVALQELARNWIAGHQPTFRLAHLHGDFSGLFSRRMQAIAVRAARGRSQALLGAPTHAGGWIDPRVLVARCQHTRQTPFDLVDQSIALLRLAPEYRAEALAEATGIEGEFGAALRYALGGPAESIGPTAEWWVAAARARAPELDDEDVERRHPGLGPDAGRAASYTLGTVTLRQHSWADPAGSQSIVVAPPLPPVYGRHLRNAEEARDLSTVMLHDVRALGADAVTRWAATTWPMDREAMFATGFDNLLNERRGTTATWLTGPFLELFPNDPLLGPMARLFLAVALSSSNTEESGLATDALIAAIDDGRLDARRLGETCRALLQRGVVKPTRWARTLGDAARVSPLHAQVIAGALQLALATDLTDPPKDLHTLLERLKELLIGLGEPFTQPKARESLGRLTRSGKTGKLVQELLALKESPDRTPQREACVRALTQRLERAEEWVRWACEAVQTPPADHHRPESRHEY